MLSWRQHQNDMWATTHHLRVCWAHLQASTYVDPLALPNISILRCYFNYFPGRILPGNVVLHMFLPYLGLTQKYFEVLRRDPKVLRSTSEYFGPERTKRAKR
jgi:hypothetical protein